MKNNVGWPQDKDPESILVDLRIDRNAEPIFSTYIKDAIIYLVDRLKKAESERDDERSERASLLQRHNHHAAELAKVNARLEVAMSKLEEMAEFDWQGNPINGCADTIAKLRSME